MKVLDEEIDFEKNKFLIFREYRSYVILYFITLFMDYFSTVYFMQKLGVEVELNFIVRNLAYAYGIYLGPFLGKFYQFFAVWGLTIIAPRLAKYLLTLVILLNIGAYLVNLSR